MSIGLQVAAGLAHCHEASVNGAVLTLVLLALAARCPNRADALLDRAEQACAGPIRVPEAVDVSLARAARSIDPAQAAALRRAAAERTHGLGGPIH